MKISYDEAVDALSIRFVEEETECRTVRLNDQVAIDLGPDEELVSLEILDASESMPDLEDHGISLENIPAA